MVEEAVNLKRRPEDAVQQDGPQQPPNVKAKDTENAEDVVKKTPKQLEKEKRKLELKERRQKKNQQEKDAVSKIPSVQIREQEKRSYEEEKKFITRISANCAEIAPNFVPGQNAPVRFYVDDILEEKLNKELEQFCSDQCGGFIPALKQLANAASLPGVVKSPVAMPDIHSGYGFCIGNVAAYDCDRDGSIVSPGGVGYDINCGVRLIRTNLNREDVQEHLPKICELIQERIPTGIKPQCTMKGLQRRDIRDIMVQGVDWALEKGLGWEEDKLNCEDEGRLEDAEIEHVSQRAEMRGLNQLCSIGAGNHYAEVQVVDEVFSDESAKAMGLEKGKVCIMVHVGSRGLGHQVATDFVCLMERDMGSSGTVINDKMLAYATIDSTLGQKYLGAMNCAANFAFCNRQVITHELRKIFHETIGKTAKEMDMHVVYDVGHNIAKREMHNVDGEERELLVHRKGSTRAFPPHHPNVPKAYEKCGQPVLVGGSMGTASYVLTGTKEGMEATFGSTCHGAGRQMARGEAKRALKHEEVFENLKEKGIVYNVLTPEAITEEAPESYKDIERVVDICHSAKISLRAVRLKPIAVVKG